MSQSDRPTTTSGDERIVEERICGVRILECSSASDTDGYRFDAPDHVGRVFDDLATAKLYADVYFDVNGFVEEGTGERGIPPELIQAGKDTLAAYFLTLPWADVSWVASFYGTTPEKIDQYVEWVRERSATIQERATDHGVE